MLHQFICDCRSPGGRLTGMKENQSRYPSGGRNTQLLGTSWSSGLLRLGTSLSLHTAAGPGGAKQGEMTFEPSNGVPHLQVMAEEDEKLHGSAVSFCQKQDAFPKFKWQIFHLNALLFHLFEQSIIR